MPTSPQLGLLQLLTMERRIKRGSLNNEFEMLLKYENMTGWMREYPFAASMGRKFRFDFAWIEQKVAIELDGGIFLPGGGGHQRPMIFERDHEKGNLAVLLGWKLGRFTAGQLKSGEAIKWLRQVLILPRNWSI